LARLLQSPARKLLHKIFGIMQVTVRHSKCFPEQPLPPLHQLRPQVRSIHVFSTFINPIFPLLIYDSLDTNSEPFIRPYPIRELSVPIVALRVEIFQTDFVEQAGKGAKHAGNRQVVRARTSCGCFQRLFTTGAWLSLSGHDSRLLTLLRSSRTAATTGSTISVRSPSFPATDKDNQGTTKVSTTLPCPKTDRRTAHTQKLDDALRLCDQGDFGGALDLAAQHGLL
jgi:hypothetical protein